MIERNSTNSVQVPFMFQDFYSFSSKIHYKPVGISLHSHRDENNREFLSYRDALRMNGHNADTDIHYLKIDAEESEFEVRKFD